MAAAPQDRPYPRRDRTVDQPHRARLDAVLRGVPPLRAVSPPHPHQHLPGALATEQVQTAEALQEGQSGLATSHLPVPENLRPLGMGCHLLAIRTARAV